nr:hypothetical protein [Tanacetum cinerariifolium]
YVNLFKDPISFEDDGNGDNVGDDVDEIGDDDGGNVDNDANDYDGNRDEEDVNEGDKYPNGSNPSFGFSKINLEDFGNDSAHSRMFVVYGVRLNLEFLAPGLWLDANSKSMFDGTLAYFDAKWESFSNQVNAQFKGNKDGLALGGIDL